MRRAHGASRKLFLQHFGYQRSPKILSLTDTQRGTRKSPTRPSAGRGFAPRQIKRVLGPHLRDVARVDATANLPACPVEHNDAINARILAVSEDKIAGFVAEPFQEIARLSGVESARRAHRASAPCSARDGPPRAPDAPGDQPRLRRARRLETTAGEARSRRSSSCSARTRSAATSSCARRMATRRGPSTNSGPRSRPRADFHSRNTPHCSPGTSARRHFRLMPAKGIFVLGVGHVRRKTVEPGDRADAPRR